MHSYSNTFGQYDRYKNALTFKNMDVRIFLAVPEMVYKERFNDSFIQFDIIQNRMSIITYDVESERIIHYLPR
ncbi:element excision factor XisH family protein [Cytophagaceae bacterium NT2B1]|nr:element excision factor XisH family protein [Xanthocytophaga flavus]